MNYSIRIKHGFPCINVCQVPREMLNINIFRGAWQTLIMFDRCYCIISTKYLLKFGENMALYFVTLWQSTRGSSLFLKSVFLVREHQKIQDGGHHSIRPRCFGNGKLVATFNCSREVQNEIKFHQQKRR